VEVISASASRAWIELTGQSAILNSSSEESGTVVKLVEYYFSTVVELACHHSDRGQFSGLKVRKLKVSHQKYY
jgi:hypothetical protein